MKKKGIKKDIGKDIEKDVVDYKDSLLRLQAEFINYKRRENEEKAKFVKFAAASVLGIILPGIDNLNLAMKHVPENLDKNWLMGLEASFKSISDGLAQVGVRKMDLVSKEFDATLAEVVGVESGEKNKVLRITQDGYLMHDRVLRLARVVVGNGEIN